jgi:hypothetical protein
VGENCHDTPALERRRHRSRNACPEALFLPRARGRPRAALLEEAPTAGRFLEEGNVIVGVFGNDNYLADFRVRREVELIRQRLRDAFAEEVGFGLSQDGYSWALLVRVDGGRYQTAVGKAFQKELLRAFLDDAVQNAWQRVSHG